MLGPPCSGARPSRSIGRRTCDPRRRRSPVMPAMAARPPTVSMQPAIRLGPAHRRDPLRVGPARLERAARAGRRARIHRHSPSAGDPRPPGAAARAHHRGALVTGQIHGTPVRLQEHRGRGQTLRSLAPRWDADPPARRPSVAPPPPALPPLSGEREDLTDRLHPHAKHMLSPGPAKPTNEQADLARDTSQDDARRHTGSRIPRQAQTRRRSTAPRHSARSRRGPVAPVAEARERRRKHGRIHAA